jgi:hypothetical protein
MGKRGPKPPDFGSLNFWEFEFYKAFHMLREGVSLPTQHLPASSLSSQEIRAFIELLSQMTDAEYYQTTRRVAQELGEKVNLQKPPIDMDIWWAARERNEEIYWLRKDLYPLRIKAQHARRKIWNDLIKADTYASLHKACGRWARLRDVRGAGLACFAGHVVENAAAFLSMKENQRFPRSKHGDDSRLEYLARGMAGAILRMSPMTAIERLRNMKHTPKGPLWITRQEAYILPANEQYCGCWRCRIKKSNGAGRISRNAYENGQRLFFELAKNTRVPKEWNAIQPAFGRPKLR